MFPKRKNPPQNVEDSKENKGYLSKKDKDDFLCYLVAQASNTKTFGFILLLLIANFVIGVVQILLLLLR